MTFLRGGLAMVIAAAALASAGCKHGPTPREKLLRRAAFDLNCTKDEISVTHIDPQTRGVRGCGRQATYVETCNAPPGNFARKCTWVMNNSGRLATDDDDDDDDDQSGK